MMVETECMLQAGMSSLPLATAFVERFCKRHDIARNDGLRLMLIVEELFVNTVMHGRGAAEGIQVRICLAAGPAQVELVYEDTADPFDPLSCVHRAPAGPESADAEGESGGFGLALVTQMADGVRYARQDGRNRLTIALARQA